MKRTFTEWLHVGYLNQIDLMRKMEIDYQNRLWDDHINFLREVHKISQGKLKIIRLNPCRNEN